MGHPKISIIITVKDDISGILTTLDSLMQQTHMPSEVIITDASDNSRLSARLDTYPSAFPIIVISQSGNRSIGRNRAIHEARHPIIAVTDAGCIPDPTWLRYITAPLSEDQQIDVVGGYYRPGISTPLSRAVAPFMCVMPDMFDPRHFLPSSRSIAFRKNVITRFGKYPEHLDTCEDLVFIQQLIAQGAQMRLAPDAQVVWPQSTTWIQAARQFFGYAKGDGTAGYIRPTTPLLFGRYAAGLSILCITLFFHVNILYPIMIFLLICYSLWALNKHSRYIPLRYRHLTLLLQYTADICVMAGMTYGSLLRVKHRRGL